MWGIPYMVYMWGILCVCGACHISRLYAQDTVSSGWDSISVESVLQCVAVCCSVLQCVAVCCGLDSTLVESVPFVVGAAPLDTMQWKVCCSVLQCVAVCCSVLQQESVPFVVGAAPLDTMHSSGLR